MGNETVILVPVIVGLVEIVKRLGMPSRFCPVLAVVLGIGLSFAGLHPSPLETILEGVVAGLSASGLYDVGKKTLLNL